VGRGGATALSQKTSTEILAPLDVISGDQDTGVPESEQKRAGEAPRSRSPRRARWEKG
jgi:hypothetical protein